MRKDTLFLSIVSAVLLSTLSFDAALAEKENRNAPESLSEMSVEAAKNGTEVAEETTDFPEDEGRDAPESLSEMSVEAAKNGTEVIN